MDEPAVVELSHMMLMRDPPDHTRLRGLVTKAFTARRIEALRDQIQNLTNRLLDSAGLPVPRSEVVDTEEGAVAAGRRLGYPCVVKPLDGNHGRGVHLDLRSEDAVRAAFQP